MTTLPNVRQLGLMLRKELCWQAAACLMHVQLPAGTRFAALMASSSPLVRTHHFILHCWSATWIMIVCRPVEGVLKPLVAHLQQAGQLARADEAFYRMNVSKGSCTCEVECSDGHRDVGVAQSRCPMPVSIL